MSPLATSLRFLQTQSDARLVELSQEGHERAFEALVHRYRRELLAYCRRLIAGEATAEDVLQQALLQAWVAMGRDAEIRDVRPWLYRIVHNVAISNIRRAGADPVELVGTEGMGGADSEVESRLAAREALAGLAALPELQRRVMLSTALEGRSHEEIAALLGLTHGAVRGLIYRARAALRAAAAAVIPGPVIGWAARHEVRGAGGSSGFYDAVAGSGTAGLGGLLIKGSAIVATAGALATAAGLTPLQVLRHGRHRAGAGPLVAARPAHDLGHAQPGSPGTGGSTAVRVAYLSRAGGSSAGGPAGGGSTGTRTQTGSALFVAAPPRHDAQSPSNGGRSSGPAWVWREQRGRERVTWRSAERRLPGELGRRRRRFIRRQRRRRLRQQHERRLVRWHRRRVLGWERWRVLRWHRRRVLRWERRRVLRWQRRRDLRRHDRWHARRFAGWDRRRDLRRRRR